MPANSVVFENLDLRLTRDGHIYASSGEASVGPVPLRLDLQDLALELSLIEAEGADSQVVRQVGARLHHALFPAPVLALAERSRVTAPQGHLRLRLHIEPEALVALPWELLHDGDSFLALRPDTSIVRYPEVARPVEPLPVEGPLRVLVAIASPVNLPALDREAQAGELKQILSGLQTQGLLEVEFLAQATYAGLMRRLRAGSFHVLHFLGYSAFDAETQQPVLLFEEENGLARKVSGDDLRRLIVRKGMESALRLILLQDCEQPAGPSQSYALGVATRLVQLGLPAVLTMQYRLPNRVAGLFAAAAYHAIASGRSLDAAVHQGRCRIKDEIQPAGRRPAAGEAAPGEWAAPVLYMRAEEGRIFQPQPVRQVALARPAGPLEAQIEAFHVQIQDPLARLTLRHLGLITAISVLVLGLLGYLGALSLDPMFISVIVVAFACLWLLRSLFQRTVPATFDKVWRRHLLLARDDGSLAQQYLDFLQDYQALLNHKRFGWITRGLGLAVAGIAWVGLWYPTFGPEDVAGLLFLLVGYVLGALLWMMIATALATRWLSYRFDLDVRPTRPDGCGGLKPLGDLYFANARVLLVAGLLVAAWVVDLSLSAAFLERHIARQNPEQARLLDHYLATCRGREPASPRPTEEELAAFQPDVCTCMGQWRTMEAVDLTPRARALYCIVAVAGDPQQSPLVTLSWQTMRYYPWLPLFQALLVIIALSALLTFLWPMYNTHRTLDQKATGFERRAASLEAEMVELERYVERYGPAGSEEEEEIVDRLEWLRERYEAYSRPPLWPFDTRVKLRMAGSLAAMVGSLILSQVLPSLIATLNRLLLGP
ncbi:MAG: CHAT domain-containing protein [Anaerolineae bacterium]|jgi:hypothetical protein